MTTTPTAPLSLRIAAPAKLNLFLHITGRREDGYHELQTVFQMLDICDYLSFTATTDGQLYLEDDTDIPAQDNLILKAASELKKHAQPTAGVSIQLEKHLPMGGGVGGGSSNAASTLLALNQLWGIDLPVQQLAGIGLKLGADVPIFVHGHSAWAEGIGEIITPVTLPKRWFVVVFPNQYISTAEVFCSKTLTRDAKICKIAAFLEHSNECEFTNHCEPVVRDLYPNMEQAFETLNAFGQPKLTGTGACIFLAFERQEDALLQYSAISALDNGWTVFLAEGLNQSPALQ
ncbi:MAG: 4-(cytidine 5'-diphospho)-2-C-methyl-D-erythritol kinase [Pseudomonadota bacterium]|nr:4-(cytidine 5'-diphospho)-2-C-methyl-D-erythritol kinase [Pseudomonadota bacterium]